MSNNHLIESEREAIKQRKLELEGKLAKVNEEIYKINKSVSLKEYAFKEVTNAGIKMDSENYCAAARHMNNAVYSYEQAYSLNKCVINKSWLDDSRKIRDDLLKFIEDYNIGEKNGN